MLTKDGKNDGVSSTASPSTGRQAGIVELHTDITEQKRLEDERLQLFDEIKGVNTKLSRSNRNLQDFALTVSSTLQDR